MHLDEVIRHFDCPKPNGANSYMVRCPMHDDSTQSLSITEKDNKILLNCFAGCNTSDILCVSGLTEKDLFNTASTPDRPPQVEYLYTPDLKKVRFYVLKNGEWKKTFCWKHRDVSGKWDKGTGGLHIPLYRQNMLEFTPIVSDDRLSWDDIINEPDVAQTAELPPVYIVEGEKDADTMNDKLGLVAVSSPHGGTAGKLDSKWRDEWNSLFAERDVVLLPDNDEVGVAFADMVARKLVSHAKSVKIVHLKDEWEMLPKKGDITDVLSIQQPFFEKSIAACVKDKLEALTICTPVFDPNTQPFSAEKEVFSSSDGISPITNSNEEIEWEKPIPFDRIELPAFPIEAMPKSLIKYLRSLSNSLQVTTDMVCCNALGILAACCQGKYKVEIKPDWREPLNLYILNIAQPSERKSAAVSTQTKPMIAYEAKYNEDNRATIEKNRMEYKALLKKQEDFIRKLAKDKDSEKAKNNEELDCVEIAEQIAHFRHKSEMKLFVDDITPENLGKVMNESNGCAAMISSEGGIFDMLSGGMYSKNVNLDIFLKSYSGDALRVDRITRDSVKVNNPALTMLLSVQPSVIEGMVSNPVFKGRGLTARFLYSMPHSLVGKRSFFTEGVPQELSLRYKELIDDLLDDAIPSESEGPEIIRLTSGARQVIAQFYEHVESELAGEYEDINEWAGKIVGTTARIAALLCRADAPIEFYTEDAHFEIDEETMCRAVAIGEYFIRHALAALNLMGADNLTKDCKYLIETVKKKKLREFTLREIMRLCQRFKKKEQLLPVLDHLTDFGYIREKAENHDGKGRPASQSFLVNPCLLPQAQDETIANDEMPVA